MSKMSLDFGETEIEFIEKELLTSVLNNNWETKLTALKKLCLVEEFKV
jgi:hypothetical protein